MNIAFAEIKNNNISKRLKTCEPRFKRIDKSHSNSLLNQSFYQSTIKEKDNFPRVNKGNALDNSKENLQYETYLSKVKSACKIDQKSIVSKYLSTLRKDYDGMSKVSRNQVLVMKLKMKEIDQMKLKNKIYKENKEQIQAKIVYKEAESEEVKLRYEQAKMQTKTLENIIKRMKMDEIFYKQSGRVKEENLKTKVKENKYKDTTLLHEEEINQKLVSNLNDCKGLYTKNKDIREKKFDDYCDKIEEVKQREKFILERKQRTYELQSIELTDTLDERNIHMREITLAHKVADSLLQSKVNTLIKKYSKVQNAFHLVQAKTSISQPQVLTNKFFSYEETCQNLVSNIYSYEKKVQELNQRKYQLNKIYSDIKVQNLLDSDQDSDKKKKLPAKVEKQTIINEINDNTLLKTKILSWVDKRLNMINPEDNKKNKRIQNKVHSLCQNVTNLIKQYENNNIFERKYEASGIRIKKIVKDSSEELSIRMKESEQMNESNLAEEQYIKNTRKSFVKKNNLMFKKMNKDSVEIPYQK